MVWAVPLVALVAIAVHPGNDNYYDSMVNYDPQGDEQLHEWQRTTLIFRYTTGLLLGQLLALLVGVVLARRHRMPVALVIAAPLATAMAAVVFGVGQWLGPHGTPMQISYEPLDDPVFVRMVVRELVAYPLYALAGVGLGVLVRNWIAQRGELLVCLLAAGWLAATFAGLVQDDEGAAPHWLYWAVPPLGAAAAVALSGTSMEVWALEPVVRGDWGDGASIGLVAGAVLYALLLNVLAVTLTPTTDARTGRRSRRL
jgi:hypothetical protein